MSNHALLSASSSHRWLNCPPSARLGENYEDKGSDFAAEGTDAHSLCEHKLKTALGIPSEDPTENLTWYNEEMEECACGYAAYVLELLAEASPDLILLDVRLPDIDGMELLRHLKADADLADIPVVVVSADAMPTQVEAALTAGALRYLTKPVSVAAVLATVDELLDRIPTQFG